MQRKKHRDEHSISPPARRRGVTCWLAVGLALLVAAISGRVEAQETWLFSPYRVNVWISYGPSVRVTAVQRAEVRRVLRARVDSWAHSTWDMKLPSVPPELRADVAQHPWEMTYKEIDAVVSGESGEETGDITPSGRA